MRTCSKMAQACVSEEQFICPLCLDLLNDPVTIPCGHSYCKSCITDCWDHEDQKRVYSCPQCRQTFSPRPALGKNTMLAEVVEKLKKTKLKAAVPAGPGDVECDICTGRKHKAVKSCLVCLESYCQTHFERHEEFHPGKRHKVIDATRQLQQMICRQHEKLLEVFCRTDQQYICMLCAKDEHKKHATVSTASLQSLSALSESTDNITISFLFSLDDVRESVCQLRHKLEDFCTEEMKKILGSVKLQSMSNKTIKNHYTVSSDSHQLTLDPNTAHKLLRLTGKNRVVTYTDTPQPYPDHPDRFDIYFQVLCRENVCGFCYWELEWSGNVGVGISVSYKSISRKGSGKECVFGRNDQSWSLSCSPSSFSFWHNNKQTKLPVPSSCRRIRVYVDHSAGTLSFCSVSDTMNPIHTVQTTFTQPLYPGFVVGYKSSMKLCDFQLI
uniref:E3 ubiquitin/ISG15 ligase TRIM25-like n=1 Tax=Sinocyclocheilus rhinocerous TaxID=307959 RepID=A0A673LAS1_9TELE